MYYTATYLQLFHYLHLNAVLCIVSCGHCNDSKEDCSSKLCDSWYDYFHDTDNCRTKGGVDKHTMQILSLLPFGFSSFYRGVITDGVFDIMLGIFTLVSLLLRCCCSNARRESDCGGTIIAWTGLIINISIVILGIVKIILTREIFEIFIIPITFMLSCFTCCTSNITDREKNIICGIICFPTLMLLVEIIKHATMVLLLDIEVDANGCNLVTDTENFKQDIWT